MSIDEPKNIDEALSASTEFDTVERWRRSKIDRRHSLIDDILAVVRSHGHDPGLDVIVSEMGVSKSLLRRNFVDSSDLAETALARYVSVEIEPRIRSALSSQKTDHPVIRAVTGAYVEVFTHDRPAYLFVTTHSAASGSKLIADTDYRIARLITAALGTSLGAQKMSTAGTAPIAFAILGTVRLCVHWWATQELVTADELVACVATMLEGGIRGITADEICGMTADEIC
ncbi:Transcriptional regulator, TetR [Rhodococcus sp. B7740]|uniref:TetR/AcrR family transcriptional regulator n=1 Tax=Rhodococcus sp. B7740 TaxID=1564114 RepID=UPI0005DA34E4|nr:TetR/AcrR family transcriptional regulator [Rhodococcus sp. B7740]AJW40227.1 Transcriptional regulator, TetR [Rhodococcus sp. B7740]